MERLIEEYRRRWLEAFDKEWNQVNVLPKGYEMKITPQPWISVSESLPGMGERVMIAHAVDKWIGVGERDIIGSYEYWSDDGEELYDPTHWRLLPELPEVE